MSSAAQASTITGFDPASFKTFRFIARGLGADGTVRLRYGLDELEFEETFTLPSVPAGTDGRSAEAVEGVLDLLHWVTGVSYYKAAIPPTIVFEGRLPGAAGLALLTALYTEGLGEFAVVNDLPDLPRPRFTDSSGPTDSRGPTDSSGPTDPRGSIYTTGACENRPATERRGDPSPGGSSSTTQGCEKRPAAGDGLPAAGDGLPAEAGGLPAAGDGLPAEAGGLPAAGDGLPAEAGEPGDGQGTAQVHRLLVPVGGGKDSAVAIEIARRTGLDTTLFSIGDATPIHETARISGYEKLTVKRRIDPLLVEANAAGALNGHVPVTAIVSAVALLTAVLSRHDAVLLANERSASAGTMVWHGIEVNHQFSKSLRVERLMSAAVAEIPRAPRIFSILRPASELNIARAFAKLTQYHPVFTSCNRVFRLDPATRAHSWCCDCDKCRFVFLILAPFMTPGHLTGIFGRDLLDDPAQYEGFALLTATGGDKPFECVGEVDECLAAIRMLSEDPRWRDHLVVERLVAEVGGVATTTDQQIQQHFALSADHNVPDELMDAVNEVLGA